MDRASLENALREKFCIERDLAEFDSISLLVRVLSGLGTESDRAKARALLIAEPSFREAIELAGIDGIDQIIK